MQWNHKQSVKEVMKHVLFRSGAHGLLDAYRRKRGFVTKHLEGGEVGERFREIYRLGTWLNTDGQESRSGLGSEASTTRSLITDLPEMLKELDCKVLLDVGCGDWNWMSSVDLPCDYIGVDIVPDVIEANKRHERPGVRFSLVNAIEDELPAADVILCREVLFHLSFKDGKAALANMKKSAKWLIVTTDDSIWFNSDIPSGDFRMINLQFSPYKFGPPGKTIRDNALCSDRVLGVWKTKDLSL